MKTLYLFLLMLPGVSLSLKAQTESPVNYEFIKTIVSGTDSASLVAIGKAGYTALPRGEFQFIKDNRIFSRVYFTKGISDGDANQKQTYWAFQVRGKDAYSDIFKTIKKGAMVKQGTRSGKPKTEYKAKDGLYYYPFEDSSINHLYWVYASKESLLD